MYKIKKSVINNRKRGPYFVALYFSALTAVCFLLTYGKDFNWISFSFIFGLTGVISVGANLIGSKHFIKYALKHELSVTTEGLKMQIHTLFCLGVTLFNVKQSLKSGQVLRLSIHLKVLLI